MNQDYGAFNHDTLNKMAEEAFSDYYRLATAPITTPSKKNLAPLAAATQKYLDICDALEASSATHKAGA